MASASTLSASGFSSAARAVASAPSKWAGRWADPEAPGCKREIVMNFDGTKGRLMGAESVGMNPGGGEKFFFEGIMSFWRL